VLSPEATKADRDNAGAELTKLLAEPCPQAQIRIVHSGDVVTGLLREARGADLIVAGGTEAGMIEHLLGFAVPLELGERAPIPVVTVYEMPAEPKRWMT
jgi:hypothetical protein